MWPGKKEMDASFHQLDDAKARARHLLTCPLCTNQYEDPRVLPCQHTFCCRCLSVHIDSIQSTAGSKRLGAFSCPLCLADVGLPAAGASAFPVDQRIRNIRDLVVEEMAKDLASRFKGRMPGDGVCNGGDVGGLGDEAHSGRHSTRLSNISERPSVDEDADWGTWPSSARARHFDHESEPIHRTPTTDDPVFSRERSGYSSVRGGPRTRRSRTDTPLKHDVDARFETRTFSDFANETLSDTDAAGFGRSTPGYSSMRVPRTRRARTTDTGAQSIYESVGQSQGRSTTSSTSFGNGHSSSRTPEPVRKSYVRQHSSHADISPQSSPFDNINRDDDTEPYVPKIGRNRLAYSSLRERRHRPPTFDGDKSFYDSPVDFVDDELLSSFGSTRSSHRERRGTRNHHTSFQTPRSEFGENLRRTTSNDDQFWTHYPPEYSSRERKMPETNHSHESQSVNSSGLRSERRNTIGSATVRQRPDTLDTSGWSVLSNLPTDMKLAAKSKVSECAMTPASDQDPSESRLHHLEDVVGHETGASESLVTGTNCASENVWPLSHEQNSVASPLNECNHVDFNKTDDGVNSKDSEPSTSDLTESVTCSKADNASPSLADMSMPASVDGSTDSVDQTKFTFDKPCSSSEEATRSPNESCFSRLTKFRASKNSRHSATESTSRDADNPGSSLEQSKTVLSPKPRARKRPQVFVGTPLILAASGATETASTSEVKNESEKCGEENQSDRTLHPASISDRKVHNEGLSSDANVKDGLKTISSSEASNMSDAQIHVDRCSSDVLPAAETELDSTDVQSSTDDVLNSQSQQHDGDSAVYSAGLDSDVSLRSTTEPCLPTPTTDDDDMMMSLEEPATVTHTDVIRCQQGDESESMTSQSTVDVRTDFDVEHHQESTSEIHESGAVENNDKDVDSGGGSSSWSDRDKLLHEPDFGQNEPADDDHTKDDNTSTNKLASEKEKVRESGFQPSTQADDVKDFDVEHHHSDPELTSEVHEVHDSEPFQNDDKDTDSGHRSSTWLDPDELFHHRNDEDIEDDVTSNNRMAPEEEDVEGGFRTSQHSVEVDEVTDDQLADGYVLATGLASLCDGSLVVADYGGGFVCLCDDEGHVEHRVTGLKPFSVATSTTPDDDQLIYVGDRRRKTLVALDRHGSDVAQWPDNHFDWICGIACLPDGHLAVLDRSRTRQLGIYSAGGDDEGRPVLELGGQGSSLGDLCMAEFVAADSQGRVLVADSGNHCIKAFDHRVPRPSVVAVYGTTRGCGDAQLEWPKGVAVDSADGVLVADCRNGRVVAFSVDGRPLGSVVPAVRGPYAVCTLPTSASHRRRLAVATFSISGISDFRIYDYDTDEIFI